jgi:hypothetical protein
MFAHPFKRNLSRVDCMNYALSLSGLRERSVSKRIPIRVPVYIVCESILGKQGLPLRSQCASFMSVKSYNLRNVNERHLWILYRLKSVNVHRVSCNKCTEYVVLQHVHRVSRIRTRAQSGSYNDSAQSVS